MTLKHWTSSRERCRINRFWCQVSWAERQALGTAFANIQPLKSGGGHYNLYVEKLTSEGRRERAGERGPPEVLDVRVAPGLPGDKQEDGRGQDCGHRHASCFRIVREMERAERQGSRSGNKHKNRRCIVCTCRIYQRQGRQEGTRPP